jgi:flagellar hook protein FlgE
MGSYSTALSGLLAAQKNLQTVSNNLSNVSTVGYKDENLTFSAVYAASTSSNGAGNPLQVGSGTTLASSYVDTTDGDASETGVSSNMAISGNGYFIVKTASGDTEYTRDGSFTTDSSGNLVSSSGATLLGYAATDGVIDSSSGLQAINVSSSVSMPAKQSTEISVTANLNASTAVDGTATSSSLNVYDSLGEAHTVTVSYTKTDTNTWEYTVSVPSSDLSVHTTYDSTNTTAVTDSTALTDGDTFTIADAATGNTYTFTASSGDTVATLEAGIESAVSSGELSSDVTVSINSDGQLVVGESTTTAGLTVTTDSSALGGSMEYAASTVIGSGTLNFDSSGDLSSITNEVAISIDNLADGASDMSLTGPFGSAGSASITQTSSDSGTSAASTDGYSSGTLSTYAVSSDGTVEGTFTNGKTLALGQVALASFTNVQGLQAVGDNSYEATSSSGQAVVGLANTGGRGTIKGGYTEASNVDIETEFSKLIVAQQAYAASAKAITTLNQTAQETLQMVS